MITDYLKTICTELKCDRAILAKIHGLKNESGHLALDSAFSIMFEHCEDIFSIKPIVQNVPTSVIATEFGNNLDAIVVGDSTSNKNKKCTAHLKNIGVEVIINQLLIQESYIWGVLSFQFKTCPSFIKNGVIDPYFVHLLKNYKQGIFTDGSP